MTFLTSRQEKPKDSFETSSHRTLDKKKRRKSTKAADTEADYSRYFMSAKPTSLEVRTSPHRRSQQDRKWSRDRELPQVIVDLPERPFLGFGSCGPNTSISPTKSPINEYSDGLRRGVSRSPTRSTSYLTWSQSRGPSYASPPPDRPHHVEPLTSSKVSNRKRTSSGPHRSHHSIELVSSPCVQTTSSGAQNAASRPLSKQKQASEVPDRNSESQLAVEERPRSKENIRASMNDETTKLDAAHIPRDIEVSISDNIQPTKAATNDCAKLALTAQNRAACQCSIHEPRRESLAHDVRPLPVQMPVKSPHKDSLDDILEALLRDCNTIANVSNPASRPISSHCNVHSSEETRIPDRVQEHSRMPADGFVKNDYSLDAPASAPNIPREPHCARLQSASMADDLRSTHTISRGSQKDSKRPSIGYTGGYAHIPTPHQVDSTNAWNGYDNFYERQEEQADLMLEPSVGRKSPGEAVQEDHSGPSGQSEHGTVLREHTSVRHPVEVRDQFDESNPYQYTMSQEGDEDDTYQAIRHHHWHNQNVDHEASYDSGASIPGVSYEGSDNGTTAMSYSKDYQIREQSFVEGTGEQKIEHQLFTTNATDDYSSWRPRQFLSRNYSLDGYAAHARVQDVDSNLSQFWSPHKLY